MASSLKEGIKSVESDKRLDILQPAQTTRSVLIRNCGAMTIPDMPEWVGIFLWLVAALYSFRDC